VLQLVERGHVDLDAPVNNYLKRAQLPRNKGQEITVRDLMLFKVKFNVGYKPVGYSAGEQLPLFIDLVRDLRPQGVRKADANSNYGQWLPLQLLLEDHYGESFATVMEREIFRPLGLEDMVYATELTPAQLRRAAKGHEEDGDAWPGTYQRYVAQGSHGLWATPRDYVRFVRAMVDIRDGLTNSVLQPATVEQAMNTTYGYRSLLFHVNDNGLPYWGGNAKGYYFQMQAHPEENWISAAAVNRQLNWRMGGPLIWQAGKLAKQWRSPGSLGIILQPGQEDDATVTAIEQYAYGKELRTERILATDGLPAGITATPAYVFQSPAGRAVFSGRHASREAIERFVRASRVSPKKTAPDERVNVLTLVRGRQTIVLPLKLTAPTGSDAPNELPTSLAAALRG
ncbi:MAG: serine hydrolase domain-containing protein, partial [Bacteroidota bacterium]